MKTPVLFIRHGAPTYALESGVLGPKLEQLGKRMIGMEAVLVSSSHWRTRGITTTPALETMHGSGGVPAELYRLQCKVAGQPSFAGHAGTLLWQAGFSEHCGPYAQEFARWIHEVVVASDIEGFLAYRFEAPHAQYAHPAEGYFLPLLVALGAPADTDEVITVEGGVTNGVLSADSYAWGVNALHETSPIRDQDRSTQQCNHLSDAEIATICHPLQFTSPQVQP